MDTLIQVDGIQIAYREIIPETIDSSLPIIFLHDSLGSITVWKQFPKLVAEQANLKSIVYDREGYGQSDPFVNAKRNNRYLELQADFLIRFLDQLNIDKCILFGHSDGGSIALIAGAKYPERIQGIITEGAHVFVEEVTLAGILAAKESFKNTDLKTKLIRHHGDKVDAIFSAWTETWLNQGFKTWNIEEFLQHIECPVLTIYGEKDEYGTLLQAESISTKISGYSEKLIIPGIGHTPHKEAKETTLMATGGFIQKRILERTQGKQK